MLYAQQNGHVPRRSHLGGRREPARWGREPADLLAAVCDAAAVSDEPDSARWPTAANLAESRRADAADLSAAVCDAATLPDQSHCSWRSATGHLGWGQCAHAHAADLSAAARHLGWGQCPDAHAADLSAAPRWRWRRWGRGGRWETPATVTRR